MERALIKTGHGYEVSDRGRCEAFDGYQVIAAPLHQPGEGWQAAFGPDARESRVFRPVNERNGVDYGSHAIKLAKEPGAYTRDLYLLVQHGGGREVWRVPSFYDGGDLEAHILAMPERVQYALLYTLYQLASNSRREAQKETSANWAQAYVDGRIRKKRATVNRAARVEIVPQWEIDLKKEKQRRQA